MTRQSLPKTLTKPLPQVGAVLHLDTELEIEEPYRGSKYWKLVGSCVRVAPDQVLTIGHLFGRAATAADVRSHYAVFFPYEGLVPVAGALEWEKGQIPGDNLALARLKGPLELWPPLRPWKIRKSSTLTEWASVYGYGSWSSDHPTMAWLNGLQHRHQVRLGRPASSEHLGWRYYDNLDLSWSSAKNGRVAAGRANSGGPILWPLNGSDVVVGINRERRDDQQVGSWIGRDRKGWLDGSLPRQRPNSGVSSTALPATRSRILRIKAAEGEVVRLTVPVGATHVRATLNASDGLRLQMDVVPASDAEGLLGRLEANNTASGRFLYRETKLPKGTQRIVIGVCRVVSAPIRAESVLAQLCVAFV